MSNNYDKSGLVYFNNIRPEIIEYVPKSTKVLLDVGCGEGFFLKEIKKSIGAETWGIELAEDISRKAINNADKIITGNVESKLAELPKNYFDCVCFCDVLEHLNDPEEVLIRAKENLTDNGVILVSVPNVRFISVIFNLIVKKDWRYERYGVMDSTHLRFFTKKSMIRTLTICGYTVLKGCGINKVGSWKFFLLDLFTFFYFRYSKFPQLFFMAIKAK